VKIWDILKNSSMAVTSGRYAMFRRILVAADGSKITGKVLSAAADLASHYSSDLHLVYVIEQGWSEGDVTRELVINELEEDAGEQVSGFERDLTALGVSAVIHIRRGHPGEIILTLADEIKADLVVLGSVGKSQISRMLSGSVSTFVVTHSHVATLVIKP
jgi:nucleotide-binding universal stress UspA family protein